MDRGAWWAAVNRVTRSRTQLKQLSMNACIGEGNGNPLHYSCLENPRDRGAWWAAVYGVAQSPTGLKRLSMHACIGEGNGNPLQYSCWRIPGTEEPGGLPPMGSHRVGHDRSDLAAAAGCINTYPFARILVDVL